MIPPLWIVSRKDLRSEMEAVAKMGAFWNIPVISYMATSNAMNDKNIYKTLARASSKSPTALAQATSALLLHYKWLKVERDAHLLQLLYA